MLVGSQAQAAASGRLVWPLCQVACVCDLAGSAREPVGRPQPSRVTAQCCLAGLPVAWPCHGDLDLLLPLLSVRGRMESCLL